MVTNRSYNNDYENIIQFLEEAHKENNNQNCWLPQKWEYTEYMVDKLNQERKGAISWHTNIRIWEEDNKIVALAHTESDDNIYIDIKTEYEYLYSEILNWCENNISDKKRINVFALESLKYQEEELTQRGYKKEMSILEDNDVGEYQNYQYTKDKIYETNLSNDFEFVCYYDVKNDCERQYAIHKGFHPTDEFPAPQTYIIPFLNMEKAPMFNGNLEIMIKDINKNKYVGMIIFWYNKETNTALLEPLSVHPEYQGKTLGYNLVQEGLKKLKNMKVDKVYVESFNSNRKSFYNKCGFITYDCAWKWIKEVDE